MIEIKQFAKFNVPKNEFKIEEKDLPEFEAAVAEHSSKIEYSGKYHDENFEYRHVILPDELARYLPKGELLREKDVRQFGVIQSPGWEHFMIHNPEPHILLFRRFVAGSRNLREKSKSTTERLKKF